MPTAPVPSEKRDLVFSLLRRRVRVGQIERQSGVSRRTVGRRLTSLSGMP
jgi:transcriptional antiterminator